MNYGDKLRQYVAQNEISQCIGVYDHFSAIIAAKKFETIFLSGLGYAASSYGLEDIGYTNWKDICRYTSGIRDILGHKNIIVDIDDGFGDTAIAAHVARSIERAGASGVIIEDQKRPRKCGHLLGKSTITKEDFVRKLVAIRKASKSLFVIARTDEKDEKMAIDRVKAYAASGADAVMIDGVSSLATLKALRNAVSIPIAVNLMHGGLSENWSKQELAEVGVSLIVYSTPCLFAAQHAIENYLKELSDKGTLPTSGTSNLSEFRELFE